MDYDEIFEQNYAKLNKQQRDAVNQISGPVLVLAGPGTGKTQLLSTRIAKILRETDANPENILAMTFTESGAQAMRDRLAQIIGARDAYAVEIHTYHGFADKLYRENRDIFGVREATDVESLQLAKDVLDKFKGIFLGEDFATEQISDLESNALAQEIFDKISRNSYLNNGAPKQAKEVLALLHDLKRNTITPDDLRDIAAENKTFAEKINKKLAEFDFTKISSGSEKTKLDAWVDFTNLFAKVDPDEKRKFKIKRLENIIRNELGELLTHADGEISKNKGSREKDNKNKLVSPFKKLGNYRDKILQKDAKGTFILNKSFSNSQLLEIAQFYEDYDAAKLAKNVYDYDDMILNAKKILEEIDEVRETLAAKYRYILLDEFQDTNVAQLEIVEQLSRGKTQPNVMAVGDDDQGIMSFQGAKFSNMIEFAKHFSVKKIFNLRENYRSAEPIVEFAKNIISGEKLPDETRNIDDGAGDRFINDPEINQEFPGLTKDLIAAKQFPTNEFGISRKLFAASSSEYSWVVNEINSIAPKDKNDDRKGLADIAVIAPKHALLEEISRYFAAAKIPVEYEARENILEDKNLVDFLAILRLVAQLADPENSAEQIDFLWPEVLAQPWWNIDPAAVLEVSRNVHRVRRELREKNEFAQSGDVEWRELIAKSDDENLRLAGEKIADLAGLVADNSTIEMINLAAGRKDLNFDGLRMPVLKLLEKNEAEYLHFVGQLNILARKFADYTSAGEDEELLIKNDAQNLANFIKMIDEYNAAEIKIADANPYSAGENSVKLMTAHHSKGLEFKYVFVVSVDNSAWNSSGKSPAIALPENLKFVRVPKDENERIRLFFVAITRAKQFLYLTSSEYDIDGKKRSPLAFLDENWERDENNELKNTISRKIPIAFSQIDDEVHNTKNEIKPAELETHWQQFYESAKISRKDLLREKIANFEISSHALTSYYDIKYDGPQEFYTHYLLGFPSDSGAQVNFGSVVHDVFDKLNKKLQDFTDENSEISLDKILDLTQKLLIAKNVGGNLEKEMKRAQQSFGDLMQFKPKLFIKNPNIEIQSEASFEKIPLEIDRQKILLNGRLDRIEINHAAKTIAIVDWKTGKITDKDKFPYLNAKGHWGGEYKLWQYETQMYFYRILLENSAEFSRKYFNQGYTFADARLEFIEGELTPDAEPITKLVQFTNNDKSNKKEKTVKQMIANLDAKIHSDDLEFAKIWPDGDNDIDDIMKFIDAEIGDKNE